MSAAIYRARLHISNAMLTMFQNTVTCNLNEFACDNVCVCTLINFHASLLIYDNNSVAECGEEEQQQQQCTATDSQQICYQFNYKCKNAPLITLLLVLCWYECSKRVEMKIFKNFRNETYFLLWQIHAKYHSELYMQTLLAITHIRKIYYI